MSQTTLQWLEVYVTVHDKTNHIALDKKQAYLVAQGDNYHFSLFGIGSIEESFLYTKICFVASRMLYSLSSSMARRSRPCS